MILLIGVTSLAPATKYKYTSEEANLSVTFPAEFTTSEESNENYKSVKTQAISDEMVFLAIYTVHDADVSEQEKLSEISINAFMEGLNGVPQIEGVGTRFHCKLQHSYEGGDHLIIVGAVEDYESEAVNPLIFFQGTYQTLS